MGACLTYLDFFSTHVQRTALSAAANCCKNVPKSSFAMIRDVMPTLENVLSNPDQQVAEKACVCVCQIVDSFAIHNAELEQLITPDLLRKLLSLVNPNVSHDTSSNIRTRVLKVIGTLAKSSHSLAGILVKEGTADLIYQILTHYSPMFDSNDCITKDNTSIIQALIHTPKDLLVTSLNIIAEVFPSVEADSETKYVSPYRIMVLDDEKRNSLVVRKEELLKYPKELEHFARVFASLLLDVYSASIDLAVRQKVLVALFKLCSCLDSHVLEKAIKNVDICALLGGIFSQGDQPSLVVGALEIGKILLSKLPSISRSQYYRLGIISQVTEISEREVAPQQTQLGEIASGSLQEDSGEEGDADSEEDDVDEEDDDDEEDSEASDLEEPSRPQQEPQSSNDRKIVLSFYSNLSQLVVHEAKRWLSLYEEQAQNVGGYEQEAERAMDNLKEISRGLEKRDSDLGSYLNNLSQVISSVSSFELVHSGVLKSIWSILVEGTDEQTEQCRREFLQVFIDHTSSETPPLGTLIDKLHEALGRSEKFDVITSGLWDSRATPASMLARQLRIRLVAQDEEEFPRQFRSVVLSIQAIATFKAVDEFYKSKLALNELLTGGGGSLSSALRRHQGPGGRLPGALAALAAATGLSRELGDEDEEQHEEENDNNGTTVHRDGDDDEPMVEELGEEVRGEGNDENGNNNDNNSSNNGGRREEDDWHLEFYLNDQVIPHDSTIYGAIYKHLEHMEKTSNSGQSTMSAQNFARSIWHNTYTIKFKKASGPPTDLDKSSEVQEAEDLNPFTQTPTSFGSDKTTAEVIRLFSVLFTLNSDVDDFLGPSVHQKSLSNSKFLSSKLTAKLNRQLEEPLVVASGTLPSWIVDATRLYPFLFPFETRYMFLQSTSFGYSRSMARWQTGNRGINNSDGTEVREDHRLPMGRLVRQKVRISRKHLLHSAIKVMDLCGASPNVLEVEYFDEVGTGLGPTLEFYSSVSREFCLKKLKLWRDDGHQQPSDSNYVFNSQGLFPSPMNEGKAQTTHGQKMIQLFKTLGIFVARAMLDSRIIDLNLNPVFFRIAGSKVTVAPSIGTVAAVDKQLANSLLSLQQFVHKKQELGSTLAPITVDGVNIEDLSLDFTCPGYPDIELVPGGSKMHVTIENVEEYLRLVVDMTLGSGVKRQIEAFREGFSQVFPYSALHAFTPEELSSLCGQGEEDWSYETLYDIVKADHGYNKDSRPVQDLLHTMNEFDGQQRRAFLQFMTGSPNLPIGGFQALHPVFTVVCKHNDDGASPDSYLPSVMTCANYLKLPNYSSKEILADKLKTAMYEGRGAFLLS